MIYGMESRLLRTHSSDMVDRKSRKVRKCLCCERLRLFFCFSPINGVYFLSRHEL